MDTTGAVADPSPWGIVLGAFGGCGSRRGAGKGLVVLGNAFFLGVPGMGTYHLSLFACWHERHKSHALMPQNDVQYVFISHSHVMFMLANQSTACQGFCLGVLDFHEQHGQATAID